MRRSSQAILQTQTSEPLIVVEDSNNETIIEEELVGCSTTLRQPSEDDSPSLNPYLLSPFAREIRKHSLPTPQCSGITASQVRRLSERSETAGPGPRQAEFLATLSTAPAPSPGGRRHSVVTISKLPTTLFGRSRRESVTGFSSGINRILPNRRESIACPPSTEPRGSIHNLQLDIMDDIVQARKVRMKLWNTSNERVCEVQPLDETNSSNIQRYTNTSGRRYSDFVGTTLAPIPSSSKRRASELPQPSSKQSGIICTNTDLISILSSLSTSATEINNQYEQDKQITSSKTTLTSSSSSNKKGRLKSSRSNSFDVSVLKDMEKNDNWFVKRHQPKDEKNKILPKTTAISPPVTDVVTSAAVASNATTAAATTTTTTSKSINRKIIVEKERGKVVWDERSGSMVDAHALGSAIEVFLRQSTPDISDGTTSIHSSSSSSSQALPITPSTTTTSNNPNKSISISSTTATTTSTQSTKKNKKGWFSSKDEETENCNSSLCSTLKDLFVK